MDSPAVILIPSDPDDVPEHTIERRATIGEVSSHLLPQWKPRRKSVSNACERCRGRKIRCDGQTPCSTCSRFSVACVRPPRHKDKIRSETQAALENRIQRLEARLAAMSGIKPGSRANNEDALASWSSTTERPEQPSLRLNTSFDLRPHSVSLDDGFGSAFSADGNAPRDIPAIEITDFETSSPTPLSPAPSLLSMTSGSSTPEPYPIMTPVLGSMLAPPISICQSPTWDALSHGDTRRESFSYDRSCRRTLTRHSSISSLGLDQDFNSMDFESPEFEDELRSPVSFSQPFEKESHETGQTAVFDGDIQIVRPSLPTRFEAETLSDVFFERMGPHMCPISRSSFQNYLDLVFKSWADNRSEWEHDLSGLPETPSSLRMAKFHVFMAMAIGMRLRTDGRGTDTVLLENCYQLAMQQAASSSFWEEIGAVEAAFLIETFARTSDAGFARP